MSGRTSFTLSSTVDGTARGDREGRKIFITFRNPVNMQMENANRILFAPTTKAIVPFALRPSKDFCFSNTPPSSPASYPHSFADNSRFTPRSHVSKKISAKKDTRFEFIRRNRENRSFSRRFLEGERGGSRACCSDDSVIDLLSSSNIIYSFTVAKDDIKDS